MPRVRVKTQHGPGGKHRAGDVIEVSEQELRDFGDKFEPLADSVLADATEAAAALAEENGIDVAGVKGSGEGGRVLKKDVEAAIG